MAGRYIIMEDGLIYSEKFQSSPGLMAGRYVTCVQTEPSMLLFQSSPGLMAGRYPCKPSPVTAR